MCAVHYHAFSGAPYPNHRSHPTACARVCQSSTHSSQRSCLAPVVFCSFRVTRSRTQHPLPGHAVEDRTSSGPDQRSPPWVPRRARIGLVTLQIGTSAAAVAGNVILTRAMIPAKPPLLHPAPPGRLPTMWLTLWRPLTEGGDERGRQRRSMVRTGRDPGCRWQNGGGEEADPPWPRTLVVTRPNPTHCRQSTGALTQLLAYCDAPGDLRALGQLGWQVRKTMRACSPE